MVGISASAKRHRPIGLLVCLMLGWGAESREIRGAESTGLFLASVFPPGGSPNSTVEWELRGFDLADCQEIQISGSGVEVLNLRPGPSRSRLAEVRIDPDADPGYREVRIAGPHGVSNARRVRIDHLPMLLESEPNDQPDQAQWVSIPSVVAGRIEATDVDLYRVRGKAGMKLTLEVEARRLGTTILPVLHVLSAKGVPIAQAQPERGLELDPRTSYCFSEDATYLLQVRDHLFAGGENSVYRLRLDPAPYGTATFPLGGVAGHELTVALSGGSLAGSITRAIKLPETPGLPIEAGAFSSSAGLIYSWGRLTTSLGPENYEVRLPGRPHHLPILPSGSTQNGRIDQPGEVDRYLVPIARSECLRFELESNHLGSWLDSVLSLRDLTGKLLLENDEDLSGGSPNAGPMGALASQRTDSVVEFRAAQDGLFLVEVADRYGRGGPEFGYRLSVQPLHRDFKARLLIAGGYRPNPRGPRESGPPTLALAGGLGMLNLSPGSMTPVNFLVIPPRDVEHTKDQTRTSPSRRRAGSILVRAVGLPPGVEAKPVTLRIPAPFRRGESIPPRGVLTGVLVLKVAPDARPAQSAMRVIARTEIDGVVTETLATAALRSPLTHEGGMDRPLTTVALELPIRVVHPRTP